jgi:hypothetical protein
LKDILFHLHSKAVVRDLLCESNAALPEVDIHPARICTPAIGRALLAQILRLAFSGSRVQD